MRRLLPDAHARHSPLGRPLSSPLRAIFLGELDAALERGGFFHLRFMDDVRVLTSTRWKLRVCAGSTGTPHDSGRHTCGVVAVGVIALR